MENEKTVLVNYDRDMSVGQAYLELGKAYYEERFEDPLPELLPLFDRITRLRSQAVAEETEIQKKGLEEKKIQATSNKLRDASAPIFCTNCGEKLEQDAVFCGNCGHRVK